MIWNNVTMVIKEMLFKLLYILKNYYLDLYLDENIFYYYQK